MQFANASDCFMQCVALRRLQGLISFATRFEAGGEPWSSDFVQCSVCY